MGRGSTRAVATGGVALLLAAMPAVPAAAAVKRPPDGATYRGSPGNVELLTSGRSITLAAFSFRCGETRGRTNVNGIRLHRTREGYRFRLRAAVSITFEDGTPDQNGEALFRGRFSRTARSVRGVFWARSPLCTRREVAWTARR
jgi:hypothetical protein